MNTEQTKLIEQLANKLGTATEYLWGVLLSQAQINAFTIIFQLICIAVAGVVLFRVHKRLSIEKDNYSAYDQNDAYGPLMIVATVIWAMVAIFGFFCIETAINGLLNPEYWALDKILRSLHN